jgi:hypothetical protein
MILTMDMVYLLVQREPSKQGMEGNKGLAPLPRRQRLLLVNDSTNAALCQ